MKDIPTIIRPEIITWVRKRLGDDVPALAKRMGVNVKKAEAWESGKEPILWKQAQKLAAKALVPFGLLFLDEPPELNPNLPDFRTLHNHNICDASPELQAVVRSAQEKQDWMSAYCQENGMEPLPFAGSLALSSSLAESVGKIKEFVDFNYMDAKDNEQYLSEMVSRIENAGVLLMRNSIVGNSTSHHLDVNEFRGFALFDKYAPLIFINTADSKNAQLFTLIHELVHILIGQGGISNNDLYTVKHNRIESFCNKAAAEFLVPAKPLTEQYRLSTDTLDDRIEKLAMYFKVSRFVIIRRCYDLKQITQADFEALWQKENMKMVHAVQRPSKGGPDFYKMLAMRNGRFFTRTVLSALANKHLTYTMAFRLLNIHDVDGLKRLETVVEKNIL